MNLFQSFKDTKKRKQVETTTITMRFPTELLKRFKAHKKKYPGSITMTGVTKFLIETYLDEADECKKNGKF
mgnify:CR=1 FL=1